jgi:hypothetical protein
MAHPCSICWPIRRWYNAKFNHLCAMHDDDYARKNMTRREADLLFGARIFQRGYPSTAVVSYLAVRMFGGNHWKRRQG